jgi:hypothetical protein
MNREEASRIARVIGSADGGCSHCVGALVEKLNALELGWKFIPIGKDLYVRNEFGDPTYRPHWIYVKAEPTR